MSYGASMINVTWRESFVCKITKRKLEGGKNQKSIPPIQFSILFPAKVWRVILPRHDFQQTSPSIDLSIDRFSGHKFLEEWKIETPRHLEVISCRLVEWIPLKNSWWRSFWFCLENFCNLSESSFQIKKEKYHLFVFLLKIISPRQIKMSSWTRTHGHQDYDPWPTVKNIYCIRQVDARNSESNWSLFNASQQ